MDNKELIEKGGKAVARYRTDLVAWVKYVFPDVVLTSQQRHLLVEVGKLYAAKIKRYKGEEMTAEEREYAAKIGISVMSGHWTGKDFISAIIHDHFLCNFPYPKLVCTANTFKQLKNVFHSEVVKSFRLSRKVDEDGATYLDSLLEIQAEKVFLKQLKGREWFSEFVTVATRGTKEEQAECLAGRNADFKLTIVDEASGIPYAVFKPFEGAMSGIINIVIMIFNPTRSSGYAIDSHGKNRERWLCFRWNAEESERTNKDAIKDLERRYGRDSNVFRIRVLGLPPLAGPDVLLPPDWIQDACMREFTPSETDPVLSGVDTGAGGDKSVHASRRGGTVLPFKRNNSANTKDVGQWAASCSLQMGSDKTFFEMDGIGRASYFEAKEFLGGKAVPVTMGGGSTRPEEHANKRAECYMNMRKAFEEGSISLKEVADDSDFIDQLLALKKEVDRTGRILINSRKDIISQTGHSPDEATAIVLTYAHREEIYRRMKENEALDAYDRKNDDRKTGGWMAA